MSRTYYFASNNTSKSSTSSAYANGVNLTFTPTASKNYAIFFQSRVNHSDITTDCWIRLVNAANISSNVLYETNQEPQTATDQMWVGGVTIYTAPASPTAQTFCVQHRVSTPTTTTITVNDQRLVALELTDTDVFSSNTATFTSNGTETDGNDVYQTLETINVAAGRWVIVSSASIQGGGLNAGGRILLWDDTNNLSYGYQNGFAGPDADNYESFWHTGSFVTTGTTNFDLRAECEYYESIGVKYRTLLALNQQGFREVFSNHRENYVTTTAVSDSDALILSATPTIGGNALVLASWTTGQQVAADGVRSNFKVGSSDYFQTDLIQTPRGSEGTRSQGDSRQINGYIGVEPLTATSTTWTINFNSDTALSTAESNRHDITVMDLQNNFKQILGVKNSGTWSNAQPYIKVAGEWKPAYVSIKIAGNWTPLQNVYVVAAGVDTTSNNYTSVFPNQPAPSPSPPVVSPGPEGG